MCIMPIYEYKCPKCGEVFDEIVKVNPDMETMKCPKCGVVAYKTIGSYKFVATGLPNGFGHK